MPTEPRLRLGRSHHGRLTRTTPCPHCARPVDRSALFCPHCGLRVVDGSVPEVGGGDEPQPAVRTEPRPRLTPPGLPVVPRLTLLDEHGGVTHEFPLERAETLIGRGAADVSFDEDQSVAREHAIVSRDPAGIRIRDLTPSGRGFTWIFARDVHVLEDGELILLGSQVIRFRRLTPHDILATGPAEQAGSRVPPADVAVLEQMLANGRTRDICYVPEGRAILIGREHGNWVFPYDPTMSARHAEVRSRPESGDVVIRDVGSRNGVGIALRAEQALSDGDRLLLGKQVLRVDLQ